MNKTQKAVIIGAGVGGITTAVFLAQKGFAVEVYEKNANPGGRCGQMSLEIIFDLYLMGFERIDIENGTFTTEELNPSPFEIKERVWKVMEKFNLN